MGSDTDDVIDNLFDTVIQIFHEAIETSERGSELIHESLALLYYYFQKIDMRIVGSYIEPSDLLKKKKATINPNNKNDDKFIQYAIPAASNHRNIGRDPQNI